MGTVNWSKTFNGKESVINELLDPGTSMLTAPFFKYFAHRFIAEGDYVVVESRGQTPSVKADHTIISTVGCAVSPKASCNSYTSTWILNSSRPRFTRMAKFDSTRNLGRVGFLGEILSLGSEAGG
jgi:hypothetical protein